MANGHDPASSRFSQELTGRVLGDAPATSGAVIVEHRYAGRVSVELERNSKGYRWNVSVAADDAAIVQALVDQLDEWLSSRFGD